jgi:hypothetical protein
VGSQADPLPETEVEAGERFVVKAADRWTNYPAQLRTISRIQAHDRLEGNMIYRGSCSNGN